MPSKTHPETPGTVEQEHRRRGSDCHVLHSLGELSLFYEFPGQESLFLLGTLSLMQNRYFLPANGDESLANTGMNVFISTALTESFMKRIVGSYTSNVHQIRRNKIINNNNLVKFT